MVFAAGSFFDPLYNFFGAILAFFYGLVPNLGISIILLTVVVMLALFPLTAKQAKAMMHMQRAQPEIKKLQAKYKHDKQKLNEEVMKFYQENKINPLAGCLPLLVQMPIFFALFHVMREPYKHIPKGSDLYAAFCTSSNGVLHTKECTAGSLPNAQHFLGMDLSQSATGVGGGFVNALPYFILVGLVIITAFAQSRQSRRNAPNMTSQMAMISTVLPIAFGLFSLQFPSGLVLYFLVSNLWRLGQQELIMRKITGPIKAQGPIDVKGAERSRGAIETAEAPPQGKAPGGLRKLFQPALPSPDPAADPVPNGEDAAKPSGNGAARKAGSPRQSGSSTAKPKPASTPSKSGAGRPSGGGGGSGASSSQQAARRRNNKKRKRR
jgi:YidC/Oxa1 family membrane protein insertase